MVLRRERVIVVSGAVDEKKLREALGLKGNAKINVGTAWLPVGVFEGSSNTRAIEAYAGKPGTPDAIPGTYKAPSVRSWAGGEVYEKPPVPKVERKALVD